MELRAVLTAAYRPYLVALLTARGLIDTPGLDSALAAGERWLDRELRAQLARPFRHQTRGPLEIFQEAVKFPTEALTAAGVAAVSRDEVTAHALPGDVYDLAPASTRDLGEEVWRAHLAWGAAKAAALRDE